MTSSNQLIRSFLYEFGPVAKKFDVETAVVTPHYVIYYCVECRAGGYIADNVDCFGGGEFCAPDPDDIGPLTGRDILYEDLRQICIWKQFGKNQNIWWDYVRIMYEMCLSDENFTKRCAEKAMEKAKIDKYAVDDCVTDSFSSSDHSKAYNYLLQKEKEALLESGIIFHPSIVINDQVFRGDLEVPEVMTAICAGFRTRPQVCIDYFIGKLPEKEKHDEGVGAGTVVLVMALSMLFLIAVLIAYWVWMRRDMKTDIRRQANTAISQYIALSETRSQ